jgi:UDP-3-O-[3-hydroxymyristoyl] glucosamine N-acyltransferase
VIDGVPLTPTSLAELATRHGGAAPNGGDRIARRLVPVAHAGEGDLSVLIHPRCVGDALRAEGRGALLLIDAALADRADVRGIRGWFHPHATWALAEVLDSASVREDDPPVVGPGSSIGKGAILMPRVRIGARVTIAAGAVIGAPGFGFATGDGGRVRDVPQLGGVVIEDDVHVGALCTIAAGTLGPTILRRGVKLDAQVHVGHNCEIGAGTMVAAQTGLAGSVVVGSGVLIGGQVGIADHLHIGDGAKIAAKSGVIGDVPAGGVVAGYPAVSRPRWLRGLAELYRLAERGRGDARSRLAAAAPSLGAAR